jgi:hypothetical protein
MLATHPGNLGNGRCHMERQMVAGSNAPDMPGLDPMTFGPMEKWKVVEILVMAQYAAHVDIPFAGS